MPKFIKPISSNMQLRFDQNLKWQEKKENPKRYTTPNCLQAQLIVQLTDKQNPIMQQGQHSAIQSRKQ